MEVDTTAFQVETGSLQQGEQRYWLENKVYKKRKNLHKDEIILVFDFIRKTCAQMFLL